MRTQLIFLCFVILSIVSSAFVLAQTPLDITTCSVTDGGKKFDLSKIQAQLAGKTGKDAAFVVNNNGMSTDYKYYFSPCQSIQGVCSDVPSAFSVQESTSFFVKNCYALAGSDGKTITAKSIDAASDKSPQKLGGVVLTYTGGSSKDLSTGDKERGTEVTLYCDPKETSAAFKLMDEVSQNGVRLYKIEGYSAYACGSSATSAGGAVAYFFLAPGFVGGFALFLLFILALYFVIGILVNKLKFKKSGKEVIPNVEFWASIPGLIKEGAGVIGDGVMKCTKRGKYASLG